MLVSGMSSSWDLIWLLLFVFFVFILTIGLHTLLTNTTSMYFEVDATFKREIRTTPPLLYVPPSHGQFYLHHFVAIWTTRSICDANMFDNGSSISIPNILQPYFEKGIPKYEFSYSKKVFKNKYLDYLSSIISISE